MGRSSCLTKSTYTCMDFVIVKRVSLSQSVLAIYAPMISTDLDTYISITRASGRELGPRNQKFFGPCEMASDR
jgi:hypothetical protein